MATGAGAPPARRRVTDVLSLQGGARVHKQGQHGKWQVRELYLAIDCRSIFWNGNQGKKTIKLAACKVSEDTVMRTPKGVPSNSKALHLTVEANGHTKEDKKTPGVDIPVAKSRSCHIIVPAAQQQIWLVLLKELSALKDPQETALYGDNDEMVTSLISAWQVHSGPRTTCFVLATMKGACRCAFRKAKKTRTSTLD